jgi:MFS family permease
MTSPTISNQRQGVAIPLTLTLTHQAIGSFFILSVSAMAPFLQDTLARAELIIGLFPSLAYLIAMGSSPIAHRVFDRFGPLGTSNLAILTGLAGYAVLTLTTPWAFFIAAILMGIAYGPLNPTSSVVLN